MDSILTWITQNQQIIYIVILMVFVGIEVIGHVAARVFTNATAILAETEIDFPRGAEAGEFHLGVGADFILRVRVEPEP